MGRSWRWMGRAAWCGGYKTCQSAKPNSLNGRAKHDRRAFAREHPVGDKLFRVWATDREFGALALFTRSGYAPVRHYIFQKADGMNSYRYTALLLKCVVPCDACQSIENEYNLPRSRFLAPLFV